MKVYAIHFDGSKESRSAYKALKLGDWPPNTFEKDIADAIEVKLYDVPGDKTRVYLYAVWEDKYKYFCNNNLDYVKKNLPEKFKKALKDKRYMWSKDIEKKLLKNARPF